MYFVGLSAGLLILGALVIGYIIMHTVSDGTGNETGHIASMMVLILAGVPFCLGLGFSIAFSIGLLLGYTI